MIPGDRQSQEDCHNLQDRSRGTQSSARKGCLSGGYSTPTRTLRMVGTTHNGTPALGESSLLWKILAAPFSY
jgi:hypothetical protein